MIDRGSETAGVHRTLACAIVLALCASPSWARAQSAPPVDAETIDAAGASVSMDDVSFDESASQEIDSSVLTPQIDALDGPGAEVDPTGVSVFETGEERASPLETLLEPFNFTLKHEIAIGINSPHETVNNRSSFRIEYEKYFLDDFYLRVDTKLNAFWGSDHRAKAENRDIFLENSSRDAFLQFSKGNTSVKVGRQVLIWGESDGGAITDVISPRNFSELFFISLEEARIGQFMATVDRFGPSGTWSLFYVPDAQFNEYPEPGTQYYIDPFQGTAEVRGGDVDRGEYGLRWKKTFGRSDIAVMAASLIDNDFSFRQAGFTDDGRLLVRRDRERFGMLGATFNFASGNWIFSGELAWKSSKAFTTDTLGLLDRPLVDAALRGEYSLGKGGTHSLSLELTNSHIRDWNDSISGTPRNSASAILGWNNTFFNDNLTVSLLSVYSKPYASLQNSIFTSYKWSDRVSLNLDVFYLDVADRRSGLAVYERENNAVFRVLYQF